MNKPPTGVPTDLSLSGYIVAYESVANGARVLHPMDWRESHRELEIAQHLIRFGYTVVLRNASVVDNDKTPDAYLWHPDDGTYTAWEFKTVDADNASNLRGSVQMQLRRASAKGSDVPNILLYLCGDLTRLGGMLFVQAGINLWLKFSDVGHIQNLAVMQFDGSCEMKPLQEWK